MDKFEERKKEFLKIAEELAELFNKKNIDYNDNFFNLETQGFPIDKKLSEIDLYLQLRRKFSRLAGFAEKKLEGKKFINNVADETEQDTVKDIAVYCIMFLIKGRMKGGN